MLHPLERVDGVAPGATGPRIDGAGDHTPTPLASATRSHALDERAILAVGIAVQLLPLVLLPYLPTQDGPSHQALAYALRVWGRPEGAALRHYMLRNPQATNWFVFFLQARLLGFLSTLQAEKVIVGVYVVLLPLALRYATRAVSKESGFLAALALPFTWSYMATMGFFNFCWSLAAFLFALGWYLRRRDAFTARHALPMALLVFWVYVCHPVTMVMLLGAVATIGAFDAWRGAAVDAGGGRALGRAFVRRLALPLVGFLPPLVLLALFFQARAGKPIRSTMSLLARLRQTAGLYTLVSVDRRMLVFALGTALLLLALAIRAARQRRTGNGWGAPADAFLLVVALFVLVTLVAPMDLAGGGFVVQRLELFPPLALLLWIAAGRFTARERLGVQVVAVVIAAGQVAMLTAHWRAIDAQIGDALAVTGAVPDGATLLPLGFAPQGRGEERTFRVNTFVHLAGYVAGRRPVVDLGLYEAGEDYFPLRWRPALDPYVHLALGDRLEETPPMVDFAGYERSGGRADYVLLWEPAAADPRDAVTAGFFAALRARYARVAVSSQRHAELWQRREASGG